jgi:hypothetical protein
MKMIAGRSSILILLAALAGCRGGIGGGSHSGTHRPPAPIPVKPFAMGTPDVVLLITGGTNGMLEVCNCSGPMPGGLARRSGLIRSYRAACERTITLDAGDAFWIVPTAVQNRFVLKGYDEIGYDALVMGDQEWGVSDKLLSEWLRAHKTTALSSTVTPARAKANVPIVPVVKRQWGPVKVAILSDVRRESFLFFPPERLAELKFTSIQDLADQSRKLKADGYAVVVVSHGDEGAVEKTAREVPADLIVRGHTRRSEKKLLTVAGKPVAKVGKEDWVGVVAMKIQAGKVTAMEYRLEVVDAHWPLDSRLLQTYQAYAHAAMRRELDKKRTKGLEWAPSAGCGNCHPGAYKKWKASRHARAFATLQKVKRTIDPNCVACHTSGFGEEKGFYTFEKTPKLANVNCQDCHRFGADEHLKEGFQFPKITTDTCESCHTPVTDLMFEFKKRTPKIRCPKEEARK